MLELTCGGVFHEHRVLHPSMYEVTQAVEAGPV